MNNSEQLNVVYWERNSLVSVLSKLFPSHLCRHPDSDVGWESDWRWIVCVHIPGSQATWHISDRDLPMFSHLTEQPNDWDGHSTEEKYQRLATAFPTPHWNRHDW